MSRPSLGAVAANWTAPGNPWEGNGAWGGTNPDGSFYTSDSQYAADAYMRLSAVWSCVTGGGDTLGQLEWHGYERRGQDKDRLDDADPIERLLTRRPNAEQTPFEFKYQMQCWAMVRPYAIAEIEWDKRGNPISMTPRHPSRVKSERLANGKRRYQYKEDDGSYRPILADNVFRLPGKPVLDYAREAFDLARAIQTQSARTFKKQIRPAGFITLDPAVKYEPDAKKRIRERITDEAGGPGGTGGIVMLPEGMKWNQVGMTNEQAQTVALVTASVEDVGRWFNWPSYRLGVHTPGAVSYASIEMYSLEFVIYWAMPWVQRWEQASERDLLVRDSVFVEFIMASLLRGTTKERYEVYALALAWGILSVNDVRRLENLNGIKGGDVYLRPLNMTATADGRVMPIYATSPDSPQGRLLRSLVQGAAGQVVRKETLAMLRVADKHRDDPEGLEAAVKDFYSTHADYVADKLHMGKPAALSWSNRQMFKLLAEGPEILPDWQSDADTMVNDLSDMALAEAF